MTKSFDDFSSKMIPCWFLSVALIVQLPVCPAGMTRSCENVFVEVLSKSMIFVERGSSSLHFNAKLKCALNVMFSWTCPANKTLSP